VGSPDEVAKDTLFLASDDRRLLDENFAAALALLDVPQFQQYESGYHHGNDRIDGIRH